MYVVDSEAVGSGARWWLLPVSIFLGTRVTSGLMLWLVGQSQYPATAWREITKSEPPMAGNQPEYLNLIANWDGQWYRAIVDKGYPEVLPRVDGEVVQNAWAFYPGYPALVRGLTELGLGFGVAASIVSLLAGALAVCLLYRLLCESADQFTALLGVLGLCFFPSAPVLQAVYTESLALLLILIAIGCLRHHRYGLVLGSAILLSLVRPIVLPLALVVAVHGAARWRREGATLSSWERVQIAATAAGCAASFALWPLIAGLVTGEPNAYFLTQEAWIQHSTDAPWPSWIAISFGNPGVFVVVASVLAFMVWIVVRPDARAWGLEGRAWVLAYGVYILASTQPTFSAFRYALLAAFPCWPFPEAGRIVSPRARVMLVIAIAMVGLVSQFFWLRLFWVPSPHSIWFP